MAQVPDVVNVRVKFLRKAHCSDLRHWMENQDNMYVGRGRILETYSFPPKSSEWANPYKSPRDGTHEQVIDKYEKWAREQIRTKPEMKANLLALTQRQRIGCWCVPKPIKFVPQSQEPVVCHAQILQKLIYELTQMEK